PVGEMRGEHQRRPAVIAQADEALDGFRRVVDMGALVGIAGADVIEVRDLGAGAAEIVPYAAQNRFDLGVALVRKGGAEIGAADAVLAQPWPDEAHEGPAHVADGHAVDAVDEGEQQRRALSRDGVSGPLEGGGQATSELLPGHTQFTLSERLWLFDSCRSSPGLSRRPRRTLQTALLRNSR